MSRPFISTDKSTNYSEINGPVTASAVGHVIVLLLMVFGLPFIASKPEMIEPVSVELVSADALQQSATPNVSEEPVPAEPEEDVEPEPEPEPTPPEPEPTPTPEPEPEVQEQAPEPVPPAPSEQVEAQEISPEAEEPAPEAPLPVGKPKPPVETPEPEPEPEEPPKEPEKTEPKKTMDSLLKDLTPAEEEEPQPKEQAAEDPKPAEPTSRFSGEQLSMGEKNAVKAGLRPCWYFDSGAANAEQLVVDLRVTMNPDRTVRAVEIVDQAKYRSNSFFRAAADAAQRAVRNPQCSPLQLPPDKYDQWKTFILTFDPSSML